MCKNGLILCADFQEVRAAFDTLSKSKMLPMMLESFLGTLHSPRRIVFVSKLNVVLYPFMMFREYEEATASDYSRNTRVYEII